MFRKILTNAWWFPLIYILTDVLIRWDKLLIFSLKQISFYSLSIFSFILFYFASLSILNSIRSKNFYYFSILFLIAILVITSILTSYSFHYFNGNFPNYYTFEYFKNEPKSAFLLLKDSINLLDLFLFSLLFLIFMLYLHRVVKNRKPMPWMLYSWSILGLGSFSILVANIKKFDQCMIVDQNFYADIVHHVIASKKNTTFTGKGLSKRNPIILSKSKTKPSYNVIYIVLESARRQHMSACGYERKTTPKLDKILKETIDRNVIYPNAFSVSSTTMLAVPAALSGVTPYQDTSLFYSQPLVWEMANSMGYHTAFHSSHSFQWYRFDRFYTHSNLDVLWNKETSGKPFFNDLGINDKFTIDAVIKNVSKINEPFFQAIQLNGTHYPYAVPDKKWKWKGSFKDEYDNAMLYQDEQIGRLFDYLKRSKKLENTLVFITSDHGESLKEHSNIGHVESYYLEALSIPMIVILPKQLQYLKVKLSKNKEKLVSNVDFAPSLNELFCLQDSSADLHKIYKNYGGFSLLKSIPKNRKLISLNNNQLAKFWVGVSILDLNFHYLYRLNIVPHKEEIYRWKKDLREEKNIIQSFSKPQKQSILREIKKYSHLKKYFPEK